VPPWLSPLPRLDLASANPWLVDWRLAEIRHHPDLCKRTLKPPHIEAQPISDSPLKDGCGWLNAVRLSTAGSVKASSDFELMAPAPLSIVCFRYRLGDDEFNKRLMVEVQRDGDSYLSNATINGRFALRACIVNFRTSIADVERLLDTIRRVAARIT